MFKSKTNFVVFVVVLAVCGLIFASVMAFLSIKDAKGETALAQDKIAELKASIGGLEASLEKTNKDVSENEERINKYQEIFTAWSNATPKVKDAVDKIMASYGLVAENAHLFTREKLQEIEDEMMNQIYSAIRSTDPLSFAKDFEKTVNEAQKSRFDNILKAKIEKIKQNGVTFPEDTKGTLEAREYYNSFLNNQDVLNSFAKERLDLELLDIEATLDSDEENDLAESFENEVASIKTPVLPTTSLEGAHMAWQTLLDAFEKDDLLKDSTIKARELLVFYTKRVNQLVELTNVIRQEIDRLHSADPNVTHEEISALDKNVEALLLLEVKIDVLNTEKTNYVALLKEARLLPHKNDAFNKIKSLYDTYYAMAQGERELLIALVDIKDASLNSIEKAQSVDEIKTLTQDTMDAFAKCFE